MVPLYTQIHIRSSNQPMFLDLGYCFQNKKYFVKHHHHHNLF